MGFVMLGIATLTTIGINAAIFGMVAHGLITGMLFFCVGSVYDRYHTRQIAEIGGGLMQKLPYLGGVFAFVVDRVARAARASRGSGARSWRCCPRYSPAGVLSDQVGLFRGFMVAGGIGTILTAGYFLWMLQRVNMGTVPEKWQRVAVPRRRRRRVDLLGAAADRRSSRSASSRACSSASPTAPSRP